MEDCIEIMTPKVNKYQNIWSKSPFIMRGDRLTALECPKCSGFLKIKYNPNGGNFECDCGYILK